MFSKFLQLSGNSLLQNLLRQGLHTSCFLPLSSSKKKYLQSSMSIIILLTAYKLEYSGWFWVRPIKKTVRNFKKVPNCNHFFLTLDRKKIDWDVLEIVIIAIGTLPFI
jgi:hypothetical protein